MTAMPILFAALVIGYLLGAIPFGYVVVRRLTGRDVTQVGSGRTGGTNAMRAGGMGAGVLTAVADFLKGIVAVELARRLAAGQPIQPWAEALAGAAAVLGHNYSVFIRFRGGAGTGPNLGAATALWLFSAVILVPAGLLVLLGTGYASVASMFVALTILLIFAVRALQGLSPWAYVLGYALITVVLVYVALWANIQRLLRGEERMVGPRARDQGQKKTDVQKVGS